MRDDWFSRLTGFNEGPYSTTKRVAQVNGATYAPRSRPEFYRSI